MDEQISLLSSSSSDEKDDPSLIKKKYDICLSSLNKYIYENYKLLDELNELTIKNNELKNKLEHMVKINEEEIFKKDLIIIKLEQENCDVKKIEDQNKKLNELNIDLETRINTMLNSTIENRKTKPIFTKQNIINYNYDHDKLKNYGKLNDDENKNEDKCCCLIT